MSKVRIPPTSRDRDLDLIRISEANPGFRVERDGDGAIVMSPNGGFGGAKSGQAFYQLLLFAQRAGGKAFDSSQGWKLRDSLGRDVDRSPDASWLCESAVSAVPPSERVSSRIVRACPDVAIEVKSPTDDWRETLEKLELYRSNGATYAVAVDPETRTVEERGTPPSGLRLDVDAIMDA